jgi:hypothetical protein
MKTQNTNNEMQMVEIDHAKFAVEMKSGNISVNLSQMAKKFGKKPSDWLRTDESKRYVDKLATKQKCVLTDLVSVVNGGKQPGTWAHDYRIVMRFAQWINEDFALSVDELLMKLMTKQAVIAEPIGGVWPIIHNGVVGYPRKELLKAAGYSPKSGMVNKLKRIYPTHHLTICRTACLSPKYARLRFEQGKVRQLEIDFRQNDVKVYEIMQEVNKITDHDLRKRIAGKVIGE